MKLFEDELATVRLQFITYIRTKLEVDDYWTEHRLSVALGNKSSTNVRRILDPTNFGRGVTIDQLLRIVLLIDPNINVQFVGKDDKLTVSFSSDHGATYVGKNTQTGTRRGASKGQAAL